MILIFAIHSFSLSNPTTLPYLLIHFFIFLSILFWSSLPLFSSFSSSPIYHRIPIFPPPNLVTTVYSKPHHNCTLLLKKSDALIFLLNFDTLILFLLSPLSLSLSQLCSTPRMPLRVYYSM